MEDTKTTNVKSEAVEVVKEIEPVDPLSEEGWFFEQEWWWEEPEVNELLKKTVERLNSELVGVPCVLYVCEYHYPYSDDVKPEVEHWATKEGCILSATMRPFGMTAFNQPKISRRGNMPCLLLNTLDENAHMSERLNFFHTVYYWDGTDYISIVDPSRKVKAKVIDYLCLHRSVTLDPRVSIEAHIAMEEKEEQSDHVALQEFPTG